jgi:hyperosmotically inducible protein
MRRIVLASLLIPALLIPLLATAGCSTTHRVSPAASKAYDDATISTRVKTALLNDPDLGALRIEVRTEQGVVTLIGAARNEAESQRAVQLARGVPGVKDVRSELKVGG